MLIKLIVGLLKSDAGTTQVMGQDTAQLSDNDLDALRQKIGFLFQSSALYDSMTIRTNLEFPLVRNKRHLGRRAIDRAVHEALDHVGLLPTINQMPAELSGGQRKRIGIARTLILKPEIMLYDEPTAGLDPITCTEINQLINDVRQEYKTSAIIITHDLTCAKVTGDRVAMLLDGRLERQGTFDAVFSTDGEQIKQFYAYNFINRMDNQHSKRAVIVGIFIELGLLILVAAVLVLGGEQKRFGKTMQVKAVFDDVSGLKAGDNIWFSGVRIGTVRRIRFTGQAQVEVDLSIEQKSHEFIRKDARCYIGSDGLIGNKVVNITGGSRRAAPIEAGDRLRT